MRPAFIEARATDTARMRLQRQASHSSFYESFSDLIFTTMAIFAERQQVKLDGSTAYAEKHMTTSGPRKIEKIVVRIDFCAGIATEMRPKLENAAMACPVAKSLATEVQQQVSFHYPD